MRTFLTLGLALALLALPSRAQSQSPPLAPTSLPRAAAPLPAMLRPAPAALPAEATLRPRLGSHLLWGGAIGAVTGALLGAYVGGITCLDTYEDEDCGDGAPVRGAIIFGLVGAGVGAAVYAIRS